VDLVSRRAHVHQLRALLEPTIEQLGLELTGIEIAGDPTGPVMRVYVDTAHGATIADCVRATHAIGPLLDVEDPIPTAYRLEVSTPGIDRLIQRPQDFARYDGLKIRLRTGFGKSRKRAQGVLRGVTDTVLNLEVPDGTGVKVRQFPLDEIDQVRLDLEPDEYAALDARRPDAQEAPHDQ
jgi:ribosome maturation factor RimP